MIAGVILAGGRGSRMGSSEKPMVRFQGKPLVTSVIDRTRPQVDALALAIWRDSLALYQEQFRNELAYVIDPVSERIGPLGGMMAGMDWAVTLKQRPSWLATFPADTPFLPRDLVERLFASSNGTRPIVARDESGPQNLCALWPLSLSAALRHGVGARDLQSVRDALVRFDAIEVWFNDPRPFFNVNTQDDLARAEQIAGLMTTDANPRRARCRE